MYGKKHRIKVNTNKEIFNVIEAIISRKEEEKTNISLER